MITLVNSLTIRQLTALLAASVMLAPGATPPPPASTAARERAGIARRATGAPMAQAAAATATTAAVAPAISSGGGGQNELAGADISVAYADASAPTPNFPAPWQGSPNVVLIGNASPANAGAIRIDNPASSHLHSHSLGSWPVSTCS